MEKIKPKNCLLGHIGSCAGCQNLTQLQKELGRESSSNQHRTREEQQAARRSIVVGLSRRLCPEGKQMQVPTLGFGKGRH
jgi:hypothetical protein